MDRRAFALAMLAADPAAIGLVASLARPGGNMTGLADNHDELVPKRLELIREIVPAAARVAVLLYPNRMSLLQLKTAQAAAPAQGLTLVPVEIKGPQPPRALVLRADHVIE